MAKQILSCTVNGEPVEILTPPYHTLLDTLREDLLDAVTRTAADPDVRVMIVTGAGKAFCAGGDVKAMNEAKDAGRDCVRLFRIDFVTHGPDSLWVRRAWAIRTVDGGAASLCEKSLSPGLQKR